MGLKFTNFARSTIANVGGISAGATSVSVQPGDGALFPSLTASDYFYGVLVDSSGNREVFKCTGRSADTLTIVRAQDGTSARIFSQGDVVSLRVNKAALEEFVDAAAQVDTLETSYNTHLSPANHFDAGTIMIFAQNSAPTGWTRKSNWQDHAVLTYRADQNISSGGSMSVKNSHWHLGPEHTHTAPAHDHAGPDHRHTIAGHQLSLAEMPVHSHNITSCMGTVNSGGPGRQGTESSQVTTTQPAGGSGGITQTHTHGSGFTGYEGDSDTGPAQYTVDDQTGLGGNDQSGLNAAPYYQDVIAAEKDY